MKNKIPIPHIYMNNYFGSVNVFSNYFTKLSSYEYWCKYSNHLIKGKQNEK